MREQGERRFVLRTRRLLPAPPVVAVALIALGGCGGESKPSTTSQLENVGRDASRSLNRFSDALRDARASNKTSVVRLRASAGRAEDDLRGARQDLGDIEDSANQKDRREVRDFEDALADLEDLAGELQSMPLARSSIEVAAERARQPARTHVSRCRESMRIVSWPAWKSGAPLPPEVSAPRSAAELPRPSRRPARCPTATTSVPRFRQRSQPGRGGRRLLSRSRLLVVSSGPACEVRTASSWPSTSRP